MSEGGQSTRMLQRNLFVTNASVNHTSETHVTGVYTPLYPPTRYDLIYCNSLYILRESVVIYESRRSDDW